jgi:hypothetical protein
MLAKVFGPLVRFPSPLLGLRRSKFFRRLVENDEQCRRTQNGRIRTGAAQTARKIVALQRAQKGAWASIRILPRAWGAPAALGSLVLQTSVTWRYQFSGLGPLLPDQKLKLLLPNKSSD